MKKWIVSGMVAGFLFAAPQVWAAEKEDNLFNMIVAPPLEWVKVTAEYPFQIGGSFFGLEGDPDKNVNYGGYNGQYGYYESMSDPIMYMYSRWGVE